VERRCEHRFRVCEAAALSVLNPADPYHESIVLLDVSRSGFRAATERGLARGTEVLVTIGSLAVFGIVRHCEPIGEGGSYIVGASITDVMSTSEDGWQDVVDSAQSKQLFATAGPWRSC
jgi:hypothetical protein